MAKPDYYVQRISKSQASSILDKYHYLKDISRGFKSGYNYGLFCSESLVGVAIFTGFPVPELVKGAFGLDRSEQEGFFELSRLCIQPQTQKTEHNITSWFLSRAIKALRKEHNSVRAILSYADSAFHEGTIYKATNFTYYGLTDKKKDFWIRQKGGTFKKHSRGKTRGLEGEWRDRTRKHRYMLVFDDSLHCRWAKSLTPTTK